MQEKTGKGENRINVYIRNEEGKLEFHEFLYNEHKHKYVDLTLRHEMMKEALEIKNRI